MECFRKLFNVFHYNLNSFNPCFNGMFSKDRCILPQQVCTDVLILVVMECFQKKVETGSFPVGVTSFNLCCNGMFSKANGGNE